MNLAFTLRTIFEIFLVVALVWGIFHEDRLIAFEKRVVALVRRHRLKVVKPVARFQVINER